MKCHIIEKVSTIYASHIFNTYTTCFEYTRVKREAIETGATVETEVWGSCTVDISKKVWEVEKNGRYFATSMEESWGVFSTLQNAGEYVAEVCWDIIPENLKEYNTHVKVEKKQRGRGKTKEVDGISIPVTNIYVHKLETDGKSLLTYLLKNGYKEDNRKDGAGVERWLYTPNSMRSILSDNGNFYMLGVRLRDRILLFKNLSTLIPATLEEIEKDFHTYNKLERFDYNEDKKAGDSLTEQEKASMFKRCMVMGDALTFLFSHNPAINGLTIGSTCIGIYKKMVGYNKFNSLFPKLEKGLDGFLRLSYYGGWCYVKEGLEGELLQGGCAYDVNSHFSSMMHSKSGNVYPYGLPIMDDVTICRDKTPEQVLKYIQAGENTYSFIEFSCNFELKEEHLPFIRIENIPNSDLGQCFKSSMEEIGHAVTLVFSQTDFILMLEQYDIKDFECLRIITFNAKAGMFDEYIDEFYYLKTRSEGAERYLYKLLLNNLYGKFGSFLERAIVTPFLNDKGVIQYKQEGGTSSFWGYLPVACACTSYARAFTLRKAQLNFDIFAYSDSDSIKTKGGASLVMGLEVDNVDLGKWKMEYGREWDEAVFVKKKTYIIRVGDTYDIKASGLSDRGKELFTYYLKVCEMKGNKEKQREYIDDLDLTEHESDWLCAMLNPALVFKRAGAEEGVRLCFEEFQGMRAFRKGLIIPSNGRTMAIKGGVTAVDGYFTII